VGTPNNIHKLISGEELGHLSLVQMAKLTYLFALILVSGLLLSQDFTAQIEGYVVRADTKEPIADANVYLLNTEIGAASDSSGFFRIEGVPSGWQEVVVSVLNYKGQSKQLTLSSGERRRIRFRLHEEVYILPEIVVSGVEAERRARNLEKFTTLFFGSGPAAAQCELKNPHTLSFRHNEGFFFVSAEAPLIIINRFLGYRLEVRLSNFSWEAGKQRVKWIENTVYMPFTGGQAEIYAQRRRQVYEKSLDYFLRWLQAGDFADSPYKLTLVTRLPGRMYNPMEVIPVAADSLLSRDPYTGRTVLQFAHYLRVERGRETSYLLLNYPEVHFNKFGFTDEVTPFQVYGFWGQQGMATYLPRYFFRNLEKSANN
jgi:hypothetical protein